MNLIEPIFMVGAIGYSALYLVFGGGLGGAVLIFIIAKMLGKRTSSWRKSCFTGANPVAGREAISDGPHGLP